MKKHYFSSISAAIAAAVLLTGCSSGNAGVNAVNDALPESSAAAHGSVSSVSSAGSAGVSGTASYHGSGAETAPAASESGVSGSAGVPGTTGTAVTSGSSGVSGAETSGSSAPEGPGSAAADVPVSTTAPKPASTSPSTTAAPYLPTDIGGTGRTGDDGIGEEIAYDDAYIAADADAVYPESAMKTDGIAAGGMVECPEPVDPLEPIDPIDPIDPIEPIEPWIDPQAGLLTGGEWNDNDHWDFWNSLYSSNNYGVDWAGYLQTWHTGMQYRAAVTVSDSSGATVSGAKVTGMGYSAVTDNKGRAYLFFEDKQFVNGPSEFTVVYNGSTQKFSEVVSGDCELDFTLESAAKPSSKTLDLMIMCDTTGSMGDELEYLKAELEDVVTRIRKDNANLPTRISVNFYRDEGDEYVVREYPFTTDLDSAVNAIAEQCADGGGDTPEAVHTALKSAVSHDWDESSVKVMFLVLDAPPHEDPQIIDEVVKCTKAAAEKGIRIVPVAASGVDKSCEYLLRSMASMTGGTYTFLTDDSGIGYGHMEPTIGSYDVEKLNDMMVRIVSGYLE